MTDRRDHERSKNVLYVLIHLLGVGLEYLMLSMLLVLKTEDAAPGMVSTSESGDRLSVREPFAEAN